MSLASQNLMVTFTGSSPASARRVLTVSKVSSNSSKQASETVNILSLVMSMYQRYFDESAVKITFASKTATITSTVMAADILP